MSFWNNALTVGVSLIGGGAGGAAISGLMMYAKARLEAGNAQILANQKAELQKIVDENRIKFSRFHIEQAKAVKEVYVDISAIDDLLRTHLRDTGKREILTRNQGMVDVKASQLLASFRRNEIYFPNPIAFQILKIAQACGKIMMTHIYKLDKDQATEDSLNGLCDEISSLRGTLKRQFQEILGMKSPLVTPDDVSPE